MYLGECVPDDAGSADTYVDDGVALGHSMESTCHEGVVVGGVAEHHKLGAADGIAALGGLGGLDHDLSHELHGIHVDTSLGGSEGDGAADVLGPGERFGDGFDEEPVRLAHSLLDEGGVASEEVDADLLRGLLQGLRDLHEVRGGLAGAGADDGDGGDGHPLVDDGDSDLEGDLVAHPDQVLGAGRDLVVDVLAQLVQVGGHAVQERDSHGDGPHVEVLRHDHLVGLEDLRDVEHGDQILCIMLKISAFWAVTLHPTLSPTASRSLTSPGKVFLYFATSTIIIMLMNSSTVVPIFAKFVDSR